MALYFETKLTYNGIQQDGSLKKVRESYMIDALSFAEAEERTIEERTPYINGESVMAVVKKTNIAEIFRDEADSDWWYKVKTEFITIDENKGVEKRTATNIMVQADSLEEAIERFHKRMEGTVADYEVVSVTKTNILEIYDAK